MDKEHYYYCNKDKEIYNDIATTYFLSMMHFALFCIMVVFVSMLLNKIT